MYSTGHDAITGMMSKFDVGSKVSKLGSTVAEIEPEAVMTATCVVLSDVTCHFLQSTLVQGFALIAHFIRIIKSSQDWKVLLQHRGPDQRHI